MTPPIDTAKAREVLAKAFDWWKLVPEKTFHCQHQWSNVSGEWCSLCGIGKEFYYSALLTRYARNSFDTIDAQSAALRDRDAEIERLKAEKRCDCMTSEQTGTANGYMCNWHRERYIADLAAMRERAEKADKLAEVLRAVRDYCVSRWNTKPELHDLCNKAKSVLAATPNGGTPYES